MWIPLGLLVRPIRDVACMWFRKDQSNDPRTFIYRFEESYPAVRCPAILSCQLWVVRLNSLEISEEEAVDALILHVSASTIGEFAEVMHSDAV